MNKMDLYVLIAIIGVIVFGIGAVGMVLNKSKHYMIDSEKVKINLVNDGETGCQIKTVKANGVISKKMIGNNSISF